MIEHLDLVIARTLAPTLQLVPAQIGFQPPAQDWRSNVTSLAGLWLNCALVDLREDRSHRSPTYGIERAAPPALTTRRVPAPFLVRCHYLLSAWSGATDPITATDDEHRLLGTVIAALADRIPLTPASVLTPVQLGALPELWRGASFDTDLLAPEGFAKLPEYWGTMGRSVPWRPCVWLAVTVPVASAPAPVDGIVTSILTTLGQGVPPASETAETLAAVGGLVNDAAGRPVTGAVVSLSDPAGQLRGRARTGGDGRFVLDGIPPGTYQVTARAAARPPLPPSTVTLPAPTDAPLELRFT